MSMAPKNFQIFSGEDTGETEIELTPYGEPNPNKEALEQEADRLFAEHRQMVIFDVVELD